ncbi:MAG: DUF2800 domain-containing protein [Oscillospiraceae bacterium]
MATPTAHALLSASSAYRWLNCPGSVALTSNMPDTDSKYTTEGRLAHSIAELKLTKHFRTGMGPKTYSTRLNKLKKDPSYAPEMESCTDTYLDYIKEISNGFLNAPFVDIEKRVDFSTFVPDGFGTADCILIYGDGLHVIDYKHGAGVPVSPEENAQLKLYALGALMEYQLLYDIRTIHMAIVQPRAGGIKEASIARDALMDWAVDYARPRAKLAYEGSAEVHSGDWCRWCKAAATCRKHSGAVTSAIEDFGGKLPPILSDAEVGKMLLKIAPLVKYAETVKAYAQNTLLTGGDIPGWKLVEGRGSRTYDDIAATFADLQAAGISEALLYERKPLTLPALETAMGKKEFDAVIGTHMIKQPGKPALAPVSDPRPAYSAGATPEEDFNIEGDN